ncbi:Flp family type IVb pilin [Ancylobacter terrae]|uniref:Flp family type IVb pilin n=1 Tax=Ancylobacter sp. sgz301288 TaxID=3342077 RepID=UPI00385D3A0B
MTPIPTFSSRPSAAALPGLFLRDQSAATAIEYAIIAGGIAVVIAVSVAQLGQNVLANYVLVSEATTPR